MSLLCLASFISIMSFTVDLYCSMLSVFLSSLWPNNIPLCGNTPLYLCIHQVMGICVVSTLRPLIDNVALDICVQVFLWRYSFHPLGFVLFFQPCPEYLNLANSLVSLSTQQGSVCSFSEGFSQTHPPPSQATSPLVPRSPCSPRLQALPMTLS